MSAVLVSLIAVAGTLLGSLTTYLDADVKGASAEGAQVRMLLLTDDDRLRQLSDDLIAEPGILRQATDGDDLRIREATFATKRATFIAAARSHIG